MYYYSYATTAAVPPPSTTTTVKPKKHHFTHRPRVPQTTPNTTAVVSPHTNNSSGGSGSIPMVLMAGGALAAGVSFLFGGNKWPLFVGAGIAAAILGGYLYYTKTVINNPFPGAWSWMQGYSIYLVAVGAIGLYLFRGIHSTAFGILGQLFFLGLLIISSGMFLTNFAGIPNVLSALPDVGSKIRKTINPNAN